MNERDGVGDLSRALVEIPRVKESMKLRHRVEMLIAVYVFVPER